MAKMDTNDIFQSVRRDNLEQFKRLLGDRNLATFTEGDRNLLHAAIAWRRPEHASELILRGINVNWQDSNGETLLHYAATLNQPDIARLILQHGGDLSIADKHGNKPLWSAVFNARGNYDIVKMFIEKRGCGDRQK